MATLIMQANESNPFQKVDYLLESKAVQKVVFLHGFIGMEGTNGHVCQTNDPACANEQLLDNCLLKK